MKRIGFLLLLVTGYWFLVSDLHALEETLTLITYYPAPYGVYKDLRVKNSTTTGYATFRGAADQTYGWELDVFGSACTAGAGNYWVGPNGVALMNVNNAPLALGTNNLGRLYILGNGNVGIGTTLPDVKLHIDNKGLTGLADTAVYDVLKLSNTRNDGSVAPKGSNFTIGLSRWINTGNNYPRTRVDFKTTGLTTDNNSTPNTIMSIRDIGTVGIGTTEPDAGLHSLGTPTAISDYGSPTYTGGGKEWTGSTYQFSSIKGAGAGYGSSPTSGWGGRAGGIFIGGNGGTYEGGGGAGIVAIGGGAPGSATKSGGGAGIYAQAGNSGDSADFKSPAGYFKGDGFTSIIASSGDIIIHHDVNNPVGLTIANSSTSSTATRGIIFNYRKVSGSDEYASITAYNENSTDYPDTLLFSINQGMSNNATESKIKFLTGGFMAMTIFNDGLSNQGGPVAINTETFPAGFRFYVNGIAGGTSSWSSSDIRYKKDLQIIQSALQKIINLNGYSFKWRAEEFSNKDFGRDIQLGLIGQEVEKVFPELVMKDQDNYEYLNYDGLLAPIIEAIKELKINNDMLKEKNAKLEEKIKKIEQNMNK